jgi:hypothetical protein
MLAGIEAGQEFLGGSPGTFPYGVTGKDWNGTPRQAGIFAPWRRRETSSINSECPDRLASRPSDHRQEPAALATSRSRLGDLAAPPATGRLPSYKPRSRWQA